MTSYRRVYIAGATYFFTVNPANRDTTLLVDRIDALRDAIGYTRRRHPFAIDTMTVMPEHIHAVWTLPPADADHSLRWRLIKTWFSRHMPQGERRRGVVRVHDWPFSTFHRDMKQGLLAPDWGGVMTARYDGAFGERG
ncbi:hypothetical protein M2650_11685 [Luteimonas sp. SX5]|uniref:Transposase IS200-like domain-containing protein n=1 Tax=Luteimonas galliterrae TaxID=2940486 RepID=A0ABT0MK92_9GAMM|nr:hypothetical protein [Luteimonas galliterrae]MCL1635287.1 hypothetical protein [Luteimonas galliterrae]